MKLDLDFTVERPDFALRLATTIDTPACGVFGPSGAGKTTLLHVIAGLVRPTRGRVVLDGEVLDDTTAGIQVPPHHRRLGVVFQLGHLLPHRTVEGNLRYGESLLPAAARRIAWSEVVELLDLGSLLSRLPRTLSGGERQRVALGRALLTSPRLLLLDEPLAPLDRGLKAQILPYLRRAREAFHLPMLHVSHDLAELLHVCDRLVLLDRGNLAASGTLAELAAEPRLLPHLHDAGLVNLLRGTVVAHHADAGLSEIALLGGGRLWSRRRSEPPGTSLELLLRPADLALALAPVAGCSIQNQLAGRITALTTAPDRVVVTIDLGQPVLTEVSPRTVSDLGLKPGMTIHVLFKAVAVAGRGEIA